MRLINAKTLQFEMFLNLDDEAPDYAIVSHTWGDDNEELSFLDVENGNNKPGIGSTKLLGSCEQAKQDGHAYVWMDTCCIDKRDSVELGEAINSMFRWYQKAKVCYAYLSDVPAHDDPKASNSKFCSSRWFQRGWTLQELLAPEKLNFYSSGWTSLGTKRNLAAVIEGITGVPREVLKGVVPLRNTSVAQRMSWAAKRQTKRKEDMSYSLLGIFGIAMPMIYGEGGEKAFLRLQEGIMKETPDHSILAWGLQVGETRELLPVDRASVTPGRILAATPTDFVNSGHIVLRKDPKTSDFVGFSHGSVQIHLPLLTAGDPSGLWLGMLNCGPENEPNTVVSIPLVESMSISSDEYLRPSELQSVLCLRSDVPTKSIHIKNDFKLEPPPGLGFQYDEDELARLGLKLICVEPRSCWDEEQNLIMARSTAASTFGITARFRHHTADSKDFVLVLELSASSQVQSKTHMAICSRETAMSEIQENFRSWGGPAFGRTSASNDLLDLEISLESVAARPCIFNIKLNLMAGEPTKTVDITVQLGTIDAAVEITRALRDLEVSKTEYDALSQRTRNAVARSKEIDAELAELDSKIRKLQQERQDLATKQSDFSLTVHRLETERAQLREKRNKGNAERIAAQQTWDKLHEVSYDPNRWEKQKQTGWTPLPWALRYDDADTVQRLLDNGANPRSEDGDGRTPLNVAAALGHVEVARVLLEAGVNINKLDQNSLSPLINAAFKGHERMVRFLLDHGAEVNQLTTSGSTALHSAVRGGASLATIQLLLDRGADACIKDKNGQLAADVGENVADKKVLEILRHAYSKSTERIAQSQTKATARPSPSHETLKEAETANDSPRSITPKLGNPSSTQKPQAEHAQKEVKPVKPLRASLFRRYR